MLSRRARYNTSQITHCIVRLYILLQVFLTLYALDLLTFIAGYAEIKESTGTNKVFQRPTGTSKDSQRPAVTYKEPQGPAGTNKDQQRSTTTSKVQVTSVYTSALHSPVSLLLNTPQNSGPLPRRSVLAVARS